MLDHDGNELEIGDRVRKHGRDDLVFEIKDFDGELVVCGNPPPAAPPPYLFPLEPGEEPPPREWPEDKVRIRFVPTDLVKII